MWNKIITPSNRKVCGVNLVTAFALNLFLEGMERKSLIEVIQFMQERTFVFLYNVLILFVCLSVVFLVKKKLFAYTMIAGSWFLIGLTNGIVLNDRKTPFTAVDITLVKSILPILKSYLKVWQIAGVVCLLVLLVIGLVCLSLYSPETKKTFDFRMNLLVVALLFLSFGILTYVGVGKGQLIRKFDNLIAGYKDYGVAYGFCVTALDTGIDRPIDYSRDKVKALMNKIDEKKEELLAAQNSSDSRKPNIIFIQLESFFDITTLKNVEVSQDPLPTLHNLQKEYTSGYLKVPVYGAGTINTEFEVLTGMSTDFFGTGEYPYRSVLHTKVCDSIGYWMKELSYETSVIHNNNASFYDREKVFSNLGIDNFITIENMNVKSKNAAGWAKDSVLTKNIMDTLNKTRAKDMIYAISVQGHGDYPTGEQADAKIEVRGKGMSESYLNQLTYYANQTNEMDTFVSNLLEELSEYPEDVMVVAYGDHLPGLDIDSADLKEGSKYETPYFIWDNFGYNKENGREESEDVAAYQLASKVLSEVNITSGFLNTYHQTMKESKNYQKNLKLFQFDMLYGGNFVREGLDALEPTKINFSLNPIRILKVKENGDKYLLLGENFTDASRVYINGILIRSKKRSAQVMEISKNAIKDGDEISIRQASETNENITLNESEIFSFEKEKAEPLYQ